MACPYVCQNSACTGQCKPGKIFCSNNEVNKCDSNGNPPTTFTPCDPNYSCDPAQGGCYCPLTSCKDGRCLNTNADPSNCGACDVKCPGSCGRGACECATPTSSNLVSNGGFDGAVSGWETPSMASASISRASLDVTNCSSSGSLLFSYTNDVANSSYSITGACFAINPSGTYNIGGWIYVPQTSLGSGQIGLLYFLDTDCKTTVNTNGQREITIGPSAPARDRWQLARLELTAPVAGAKAAKFVVELDSGKAGLAQAYFDVFYLTPAPGQF